MSQVNGTPVNFAFNGPNGITLQGIAGMLLQSAEHSAGADKDEVRAASGDKITRSWYDRHTKTNLEFAIIGTGLADAINNTTLSSFLAGSFVNITRCDSDPDLVGSGWEVQEGSKISGSNVNAKRLTLPLEKRSGITGPAPA